MYGLAADPKGNTITNHFILPPQPQDHMVCAQSLSHVRLCATPWTVARQAPLSMGILQARILEWVAMPSSRGAFQPTDRTQVPYVAGGFFTISATREAQEYWSG